MTYQVYNNQGSLKLNNKLLLLAVVSLCLTTMIFISPLITFCLVAVILTLLNIDDVKIRAPFSILGLLSGVAIYSSRLVGNIYGDDVANEYYPLYQEMVNGGNVFDSGFGGNIEFGLPLYFKLLGFLLPHLDENAVMFSVSALCSVLFYIWIETYFFKEIEIKNKSLFIASIVLFFGFFVTTQLMRQAISTVMVLFVISNYRQGKKGKSIIYLVLGSIFHLTAIPFALINYIFLYGTHKKRIIISFAFVFFGMLFISILKLVAGSGIFFGVVSKFLYYLKNTSNGIDTAYYWKILIPIFLVSLFFVKKQNEMFRWFLFYSLIGYLSLIQIPFASDRCFMVLNVFLLGAVIYFSFERIIGVYQIILILFCIFRFIQLGPLYPSQCGGTVLCLWAEYPWIGSFLG
jgi:hypothetical protein